MRILKRPPNDHRPSLMAAELSRREAIARAEYLAARYFAPPAAAEAIVLGMDIPTQTFLAIEMAEQRQSRYTAEYDPFGAM